MTSMGWKAERPLSAANPSKRKMSNDLPIAVDQDMDRRQSCMDLRSFRRQGFNDPAIVDDAALALVDHSVEFGLERHEISDLLFDLCTMFASDGINCCAGLSAIVG